jgi:hypothetical protein
MLKLILFFSLINTSAINQYASVDSIAYYQSNKDDKKIDFEFNCDYFNVYKFNVIIDLYNCNGENIGKYTNAIEVIGRSNKTAIIHCDYQEDFYALINVEVNDLLIVKNGKINFYIQGDCYLNLDERKCERVYKSEYKNKTSKDYNLDFVINKNIFDKFLGENFLDVYEITFYSNYEFKDSNIYLIVNQYIDEYEIYYDNGYMFFLAPIKNGAYRFSILDTLYVDLLNFRFSDNHFLNSKKTDVIHFPYSKEYKEYKCMLVIDSFISIYVNFVVSTSDLLLGDCKDSKYCLVRESYD